MTQGQRLRGRFLISLVSKQGEEENQRRKKERKGKKEKEEKREKEREAGRSDFPRSLALRWSKFVGSRVKVGIRDESDAWGTKITEFCYGSELEKFGKSMVSALQEVGVFSYFWLIFI